MSSSRPKLFVSISPPGIFVVDEAEKIVHELIFEKDPEMVARKLLEVSGKQLSDDEREIVERFSPSHDVVFEREKEGQAFQFPNLAGKQVRKNLFSIARKHGFAKDKKSFVRFMSEVAYTYTKLRLKSSQYLDRHIMHLAEAIDELDKAINLLVVRLREWYGMYYPEFVRTEENEEIVKYIVKKLYRGEDSVGFDMKNDELEVIRKFASRIEDLYRSREELKAELKRKMEELMPNTTHIIGAEIAAKLLTLAGSFEKLAKLPSSTIQVLGAEKALFRYLSGKGKSPKHGVIFLTPYIQRVPKRMRGKMARKLASKIAIAVKLDYFNPEKFEGDKLKAELEEEMRRLQKGVEA